MDSENPIFSIDFEVFSEVLKPSELNFKGNKRKPLKKKPNSGLFYI